MLAVAFRGPIPWAGLGSRLLCRRLRDGRLGAQELVDEGCREVVSWCCSWIWWAVSWDAQSGRRFRLAR